MKLLSCVVAVALTALQLAAGDDQPVHATPRFGEPVNNKVRLGSLSLGPGPFPANPEHMEFTLHGTAQRTHGNIRLTGLQTSSKGALWSRKTLPNPMAHSKLGNVEVFKPMLNAQSWQVDVRFTVGGSPNTDHFGDGFAFWAIAERGQLGDALGGPDNWTGLAVFFDTFKNDNFKLKKHPYVYGKISALGHNAHYNTLKDQESSVPGCHVPFRNPDPNVLDTTVARITYMDRTVSVLMRPRGAVDWLQCFEIQGAILPGTMYLGVTAMTGQLVDIHDFVSITTYANIETQPFTYAVKNDVAQMPELWNSMRESGKSAREFADWEKEDTSFKDELEWTVSRNVKAHLNDDYDDAYQPHAYEHDDEDDDSDDPYAHVTEYERLNEKLPDPDKQTQTMKDLERVIMNSPVGQTLEKQHYTNAEKMERLHRQLLNEMQDVTDSLHMAAREVRAREHEISERILKLAHEMKLNVINPFEAEMERASGDWFWWFVLVAVLVAAYTMFGYTRYRKFMKQHVL